MDYKVLPTKIGLAKLANYLITGKPVTFKHMAIGDGGGVPVEPNQNQTALIRETARQQINTVTIDPLNDNQFIVEAIIPEDVGNFYIREAGIFDDEGNLIFIANYPESYKPLMVAGSGKVLRLRLYIQVSEAASVTLKIDPSVVLATREFVDITIGNKINDLRSELSKTSVFLYGSVPSTKQGEIIYVEPFGFMKWIQKWSMYRSINASQKITGWATTPQAGHIEANGAWYSKSGNYKGLWTAALDAGLVLQPVNWYVGQYIFIDEGGDLFRVPDLRGYFDRNASMGSDVDAGRIIFSGQFDDFKSHTHTSETGLAQGASGGMHFMRQSGGNNLHYLSASGGLETRPKNTAFPAWIKY